MVKGSSGDRNGGFDRNDGGIAAEPEAVAVAAMVETVVATAAKLRRLQQNVSCGCYSLRDYGCGGGGIGSG